MEENKEIKKVESNKVGTNKVETGKVDTGKVELNTDMKIEISSKQQPVSSSEDNLVRTTIFNAAAEAKDYKQVIDLATTGKALQNKETVDKMVEEKTEELQRDAEARRIKAETDKIKEEVAKSKQEMEKELAELEKQKKSLEAEVETLKAEDDKALAYFNSNKSILRCIGVREKLSLRAMRSWMPLASFIHLIFQIILLPFTLIGFAAEQIIGIVEAICGKVAKGGWRILIAIVISAAAIGLVAGIYYLAVYLIGKI